jgi:hypothetical protein
MICIGQLREPEVGEVRLVITIDEDIARFDVTVEHSAFVCVMHRPRNRGYELRNPGLHRPDGRL